MPKAISASMIGIMALWMTTGVVADARIHHDDVKRLRESGQILPMNQVLDAAHRIQPGQLVEAELEHARHGYHYEIKILDEAGHLHEIELDASTATLIDRAER